MTPPHATAYPALMRAWQSLGGVLAALAISTAVHAGDVTVAVHGDRVIVTGSADRDVIVVQDAIEPPGAMEVDSGDGGVTTVNGGMRAMIAAVTGDVVIDTGKRRR